MPLDKDTPVGKWIDDFIKSTNPKFDGKSKAKRREMAIAAAMDAKNESEEVLLEGIHDPAIFHAVFLAGGPGSGKSFIVGKSALSALGFVTINSDNAFEHLMQKLGLNMKMPEDESEQRDIARNIAKTTTDKKMSLALEGRLGLVIDGTGRDYDKIKSMYDKMVKYGYDCAMIFVNTDQETALQRNAKRARSVPEHIAKDLWANVQRNIGKFQSLFHDKFHLIDNSQGSDPSEQITRVYKSISAWSKKRAANPIAIKWIQTQKVLRESEVILIENLDPLDERLIPMTHPIANSIKSNSPNQEIHSIKHIGDSPNGKYTHVEVRVKDRVNPNAVRIKKMMVHATSGEPIKSKLSPHLTDVRHLDESPETDTEEYMDKEDQINELSTDTLGSYAKKATREVGGARQLKKTPGVNPEMKSYADTLIKKRLSGLNRLAKPVEESYAEPVSYEDRNDYTIKKEGREMDTKTSNRKHFEGLMHIMKNNHAGWDIYSHDSTKYSTKWEDGLEKHYLHGKKGSLLIGEWDHSKNRGKYISADKPNRMHESEDAEMASLINESELRGGMSDVHTHLSAALKRYLEQHGDSVEHINKVANILGSEVTKDSTKRTTPYSIKKK